ncbi:MAG TPA: histidine kinase [Dehalococcoidia bacterium]|nr:histidine kinase [Dehalococcoidia bacterium]
MNSDSLESAATHEVERDLHDRTIQALYGVMLQMENCTHLLEESSSKTRAELDVAIDKVNAIIGDVRNRIYELGGGKPGRTPKNRE